MRDYIKANGLNSRRSLIFFCIMFQAVQLNKFDYRLSNKLSDELQKLRCRVNYHALKFTDPILKMGNELVRRMRLRSKHFIALHLRYHHLSPSNLKECFDESLLQV